MSPLLNLLWFLLGGFAVFILYVLGGLLLCLTIIGIPFGLACFRLAGLGAAPFGKEIIEKKPEGGIVMVLLNVLWIFFIGIELALVHLVLAIILGITIVGIPFATQHLKMIHMALIPFGFTYRNLP